MRLRDERGYLMVALLVAMSIMAIMMSVALPAWRTIAQREKEAELIFRGEQYARAIGLFQRRYANATPPNLDVLINERFLRKKYKDPITRDDFQLISPGANMPGMPGAPQEGFGLSNPAGRGGRGFELAAPGGRQGQSGQAQTAGRAGGVGGVGAGGVIGVVSKSTERAFRLYNGRDAYNQWVFLAIQQSNRAGGPGGAPPGAVGPRGGVPGFGRGGGPNAPPGGFDGGRGLGGGRDGRGGRDQGPGRGFPPPAGGRGGQPQNPGRGGRGF
jgi:type II secretory pathway pseudopilin PulG